MNLKEILENHKKWLNKEVGGVKAILRGADLTGAHLSNADLTGAYLSYADLRYASLSGVILHNANLHGADLSGADLTGAYLSNADLTGAYLSYADVRYANLSSANLHSANLTGASLNGAILYDANLHGADIRWVTGYMKEIKSIKLETWNIVFTTDVMAIGCQQHRIEDWRKFTDDEIAKMDVRALEGWKKWKDILFQIIEV